MKTKKHEFDSQLQITSDSDLQLMEVHGVTVIDGNEAQAEIDLIRSMEKVIDKDYVIKIISPVTRPSKSMRRDRIIRCKQLTELISEERKIKLLKEVFRGEKDEYTLKLRKSSTIKISVR